MDGRNPETEEAEWQYIDMYIFNCLFPISSGASKDFDMVVNDFKRFAISRSKMQPLGFFHKNKKFMSYGVCCLDSLISAAIVTSYLYINMLK
jgi:hypothetical protein